MFNNRFEHHDTTSVIIVSYRLVGLGKESTDKRLDGYTEGLHVHHNTCIDPDNSFDGDSQRYVNFHWLEGWSCCTRSSGTIPPCWPMRTT